MGTPFINVSFSGLLWGYEDDLYCLELDVPKGCNKGNDPFSAGGGGDDPFGGDGDDWDFKRKKRSVSSGEEIFEKPGKFEKEMHPRKGCVSSFLLSITLFKILLGAD